MSMQPAARFHPVPYHFANLPSFTRNEVSLWNWYSRVFPHQTEWTAWVSEIFGRLVEQPAGVELQLVETHAVDAQFGEKILRFGSKHELSIGRGAENDVVLAANAIATRHTRVALKDGRVFLEDLGSRLGTYLWDKKIPPNQVQAIGNGDQFTVFPYRFRVQVEQSWKPETNVAVTECRTLPLSQAEFFANSPRGWRLFVVNTHPDGNRALLEVSPTLLTNLAERILGPLGLEKIKTTVDSDDTVLEFVVLALIERLNRKLRFPVQFSLARGNRKRLADGARGTLLSLAVGLGGLTGHFRIFLPLDFLSSCKPDVPCDFQANYPLGLCWSLPISAGFVDLSVEEISEVGLGDILIAQHAPATLFPNDFSKGWMMIEEASNSRRFQIDKYFERSMSVEGGDDRPPAGKPDIGALPLRLQVILAEKEFTLEEIQTLSPGSIVELETTEAAPVRLMVNGKMLGEGELVDVEGKLAVKVLRWRDSR